MIVPGLIILMGQGSLAAHAQSIGSDLPGAKYATVRVTCSVDATGTGRCRFRNQSRHAIEVCYRVSIVGRTFHARAPGVRVCSGRLRPRGRSIRSFRLRPVNLCNLHTTLQRRSLSSVCRLSWTKLTPARP